MKMNKSMYLFATALVAGTLGMTSCTSEEFVDGAGSGTENTVTLSMSVADKFGTRSNANEVNLGGSANLQTISNVTVVPMRGASSLNPIVLGDLDPKDGNRKVEKKTPLNSLVDAFKVYGNVPAEKFDVTKAFTGFTISTTTSTSAGTIKGFNNETLYEPHKLYYYGYAKAADGNSIFVGNDYASASTALKNGETIGSNKYVKVTGVNYAVGVLAAAVLSGDNETKTYTKSDGSYTESPSELVKDVVTLKGIFFDNQKESFNEDFETSGTDISVYSEATASTLASTKIDFDDTHKTITGANFYVIANATTIAAEDWVKGNFVFTLPAGKYIKVGTGNTDADFIGNESEPTLFYIAFKMEPKESQAVFQKDHTTIINATVKKWGLASDKPVEVTDVTLGVVIDMDWQEGLSYDVEI